MDQRSRLRIGTLLWFALLGATIAITYHQELVAGRIGLLIDEQRELRSEAERLSANSAVMRERLDDLALDERIARAVVEERAKHMRFDGADGSRWVPPFAAWELELLWDLNEQQARQLAEQLTRLHLQLRNADKTQVTPALDAFEAALDASIGPEQRQAIHSWRQHLESAMVNAAPTDKPVDKRKPGAGDAGL